MAIEEIVTIRRPLDPRLEDLVLFAKYLTEGGKDVRSMTEGQLVAAAHAFWDRQHGED